MIKLSKLTKAGISECNFDIAARFMRRNEMSLRKTTGSAFILFLVLIGFTNSVLAQSKRDTLQEKMDSVLLGRIHTLDSAQSHIASKIDSLAKLPLRLAHFSDTLNPDLSKYNRKLDSIKGKLTHRIDSLQRLNLPTSQYTHLLDSIDRAGPLKDISKAEAELTSLE